MKLLLSTQIILSGDFYQLPPVSKKGGAPARFAFEAESWTKCIEKMVNLTTVCVAMISLLCSLFDVRC